jgi:hypothetical protein
MNKAGAALMSFESIKVVRWTISSIVVVSNALGCSDEAFQWSEKNQQKNSNSALWQWQVRSLYWIFVLSCIYLTSKSITHSKDNI